MYFDKKIYFISGIDTDAGKSYATAMLAKNAISTVITQKFVQTGQDPTQISEDILTHRRLMGVELFEEDVDKTTCPIIFRLPSSPHLAAREEGKVVNIGFIERSTEILASRFDLVLIEGAGGLMVPVTESYLTADYIVDHKLPLILVVTAKLGSLNHALLSLEYCRNRGIDLAAVVYNTHISTNDIITADTAKMVQGYLGAHYPAAQFVTLDTMG